MPAPRRRPERRERAKKEPDVKSLYTEKFDDTGFETPPVPKISLFIRVTKYFGSKARGMKGPAFTPEQRELFDFLNWDLTASEFYATARSIMVFGLGIGVVLGAIFFLFLAPILKLGTDIASLVSLVFVLIPFMGSLYYQQYPKMFAEREKMRSLAYVPEIINYLVMSLRINPNLEKAVEFASQHGRGKISDELKELIWDVQIGKFLSIEEGLDKLAYRWGNYSDDFKHSLMIIRSSVLETDKERRAQLLEKATADVLEGSREKMDLYARGLHQPSVFLYYFGILLPLMLAIILPIAAAFVKDVPIATKTSIFLIYGVLIPAGIYVYGNNILGGRPPTYVAPEIPPDYPGLPKKGNMRWMGMQFSYTLLAILVFFGVFMIGNAIDGWTMSHIAEYELEEQLRLIPSAEFAGFTFYIYSIFSLIIGTSLAISVYLLGKYGERKKVQDELRAMEGEFKDSVYVLASRLAENRPMEDALAHAIEFLPKSKVSNRVFRKVLENVVLLGLTLEAAVFDRVYGAMRNLPSQTIRSGMRVMVDSVELGVNTAAKALIQLSMQIRNAQKIDESLKKLLSDITMLLNTMATFIAPIVLAVVSSLQTIIINSLSGLGGTSQLESATGGTRIGGMNFKGLGSVLDTSSIRDNSASPGEFLLIMGIYVIEVVILLTYFNSQIEDSNNKLHTYVSIAKALPVASVIFAVVAYFASSSLSGLG
ncbi:type II secretion system F family protein [Candidatus Micrarchaeota archaeon]|nr:type II secretion system F family protein [Candidatus Micrarchaeota archaeon]